MFSQNAAICSVRWIYYYDIIKNDSLIRLNCSVPVVLYSPAIQIHRASIFHAAVQLRLPELYRGSPFTLPPLFCYF